MSEKQPKYRVKETYQYCDEMGEIGAMRKNGYSKKQFKMITGL